MEYPECFGYPKKQNKKTIKRKKRKKIAVPWHDTVPWHATPCRSLVRHDTWHGGRFEIPPYRTTFLSYGTGWYFKCQIACFYVQSRLSGSKRHGSSIQVFGNAQRLSMLDKVLCNEEWSFLYPFHKVLEDNSKARRKVWSHTPSSENQEYQLLL